MGWGVRLRIIVYEWESLTLGRWNSLCQGSWIGVRRGDGQVSQLFMLLAGGRDSGPRLSVFRMFMGWAWSLVRAGLLRYVEGGSR